MKMRSSAILSELVDRWLTKVATLIAVYVTFRGHNAPGGGFAGGLLLGAAFVLQFLAGDEPSIRRRPIRNPEMLLGVGLLAAFGTTLAPLIAGGSPLESYIWKLDVPVIGEVKFVSSTLFDLGVFAVVVAVVLMILRALGTEGAGVSAHRGRAASRDQGGAPR
ncbi:MAG: MnhB domain-containing protein [Ilumatobacteraceae bacterium]|jgi:multicomponent Na+:H+ antiporter subunit A